ncbi:MAG TPA: hypothetical protein DCM86_19860 [Verrucomicrobiales bacterium]|nr:hypothetical protein [Verrucomicrobiales bacterium]
MNPLRSALFPRFRNPGGLLLGMILAWSLPAARGAVAVSEPDPVKVDAKTEGVIQGALRFLVSKQQPNGAWGTQDEELRHQVAITGYVLMAFQAAGQLPNEGEFGKAVQLGVQFLLDSTAPEGLIGNRNNGQYMYNHGIAAIALGEIYGQTRSPAIRTKLDRIIKVILSSQNPEGGWRYRPIARDADISVTVLQVVALRAAKNGGLEVPQRTIDNAVKYVRSCFHEKSGGFCYQPQHEPGYARTAAAIYSLQVCGLYADPMVLAGSKYLSSIPRASQDWFTYGNFYAAPAQYMVGGETWAKYYSSIHDVLLQNVSSRGNLSWWEPTLDQGRMGVGQVYSTAVYSMILSMPYHYIPLYQR